MLPDKRDETRPPKTRFSFRDRSKEMRMTCIPRLKSFPAEKIKKLDNLPMFSSESIGVPQDEVSLVDSPVGIANCDRGDGMSAELSPGYQQFKSQCASIMNQQQVVPNHRQTDQTRPQSDSLQTGQIGSTKEQVYRTFAASANQEAVVRDRSLPNSPTMVNQSVIVENSRTRGMKRAFERSPCAGIDRHRDEDAVLDTDYEEQPVGGRNAASYKQMIMQMQQQKQDASNCQGIQLQGARRTPSHDQSSENPQQPMYQQLQRDAYHQQISQASHHALSTSNQQVHSNPGVHCNYLNQRLSTAQLAPAQGMTSPQDMTMSQMRLMRHNLPVHQQSLGYPIGQSAWLRDERCASQQQAPLPQWNCYHQNPAPNSSCCRQYPESQDQSMSSRHQTSRKAVVDQQPGAEVHGRQHSSKKTLQFTPDMIHDQELLVSTMRQQCVPHDVMRRQFDALLNEQRRHLAYIAQFQQQTADAEAEIKRTCRLIRRRTENDEKPEWMVHITPSRISYSDLERIKSQQRILRPSEQQPTNAQSPEVGGTMPAQQQQQDCRQPREETSAQAVLPQRMYLRMDPHPWQQQTADWSRRDEHRAPCVGCYPYSHLQNAPNHFYQKQGFDGYEQCPERFYQYNAPHNSCQTHPEHQKVWSEQHNATSLRPIDKQAESRDTVRERGERPIESSSLLKMRTYREVIRPQKRNNGLQDPVTIQRTLETLKDPASRKGLEYLANLARKKPAIKLNGTQEPDEIPEDLRLHQASLENSQAPKRISSNGLENNRNPDNPVPRVSRFGRFDEPVMMEYPRQRQGPKTCYDGASAEMAARSSQQRDHAVPQDARSIPCDRANLPAPTTLARPDNHAVNLQYGGTPHYQQMQRCYHNRQILASNNGGQGDGIASIERPDAPAMGIDRAGGDTLGENPSAEEATKRGYGERSMPGTSPYGRAEIRDARIIDCAGTRLF
ncbi:PREDICTED: uncharacterized protein LOC106745991 [Dinoponera quadriceps]|uniref:Uncharacterized protein LOC106745991 n=1 Tax=Dinoponera quadriceps TaxID=609295 RepID=A0A6P3XGJ9_DINQU|nr:PREDICTED: uncharacterized protein LOC106745991 [Dinoponera quadriceps]